MAFKVSAVMALSLRLFTSMTGSARSASGVVGGFGGSRSSLVASASRSATPWPAAR